MSGETGAVTTIRTLDILITKQVLYLLSYNGEIINLLVRFIDRRRGYG